MNDSKQEKEIVTKLLNLYSANKNPIDFGISFNIKNQSISIEIDNKNLEITRYQLSNYHGEEVSDKIVSWAKCLKK